MSYDYKRNLLSETVELIKAYGKHETDVQWVGNDAVWFTWDEFAAVADVVYDAGFGGQEIETSLLVVGSDWWLERHEYDGSEWWEFKVLPTKPDCHITPTSVSDSEAKSDWGSWRNKNWTCPR